MAVATALTGLFTGLEWLTVVALIFWIAAMLHFGIGKRKPEPGESDSG